MPNMADLKMIADGTVKARLKDTASKRGHVGWLVVRYHASKKVIKNYGKYSIFIEDEKRVHWRFYWIRPQNINGQAPHPQLELKSGQRYMLFVDWVKDEGNLRDLAVAITDSECEGPDGNLKENIDDKEDELREHFGLKPFNRPTRHVGKPSPI